MQCQKSLGLRQALYQTFVIPALQQQTVLPRRVAVQPVLRRDQRPSPHQCQRRAFTNSSKSLAKSRPPEANRGIQKWDDEITARVIMLVDPATNRLVEEPRTRFDVLNNLDRRTHRLLQVSPDGAEGPVVCKIINKKEAFDAEKRRKLEQKETRKEKKVIQSTKTLELNWAIDGNDLGHRLERMGEFLAEGRKVEVVLAVKKQGRKAARAECEDVLRRIREAVSSVPGAREVSMEGKVGGFVTMLLQGKPQAQDKDAATAQG